MMEAPASSETSVLTRTTRRNIPKDAIIHSQNSESLKSYIALTDRTLYWRRNVSPVKYELGFYIPEDGILHSHRHENPKSCISLSVVNCRYSNGSACVDAYSNLCFVSNVGHTATNAVSVWSPSH
jgi:hypothetical protein